MARERRGRRRLWAVSADSRDDRFPRAVEAFASAVAQRFAAPVDAQPEAQLTEPVGDLLRECGEPWNLTVDSHEQVKAPGIGWPDLGVSVGGLLCGYVELKAPGLGTRPEQFDRRNREQWKRYRALPNLIYTDGSEWSLYRTGERAHRVHIADNVRDGARSLDHARLPELSALLRDFLHWEPDVPKTPEALAAFLAPLARFLRDEVRDALKRENAPLKQLASEWQGLLFAEADDAQFADAYAQTLTYALLLAHFEGAESLEEAHAAAALRREHALLAEVLRLLEAPTVRAQLGLPIDLLERAIKAVNTDALQPASGDFWLYFYELFLAAYDPALRRNRGVYFTPAEVVRCQVRLAGQLLRERFDKPRAFADDGVTVLDPATGTGAYPIAVLDHAARAVRDHYGEGAVQNRLAELADRLHGFELLVGPYSVAHLRVTQRLRDAGVTDRPARIYLADTLESPYQPSQFTASILQEQITEEREAARQVKRNTRVLVCLGNPPYDREQQEVGAARDRRKGGWVRYGDDGPDAAPPILDDFLRSEAGPLPGAHAASLYNDYVYFWRWALWKVFDSTGDGGIVTFITASSYLRGQSFPGMRRTMREVFDELWIIDLGGEGRGARQSENVFSIQTPVAIAIGVRDGKPDPHRPARVWRTRLSGTEQEKLEALKAVQSHGSLAWASCSQEWEAPFVHVDESAYASWPQITTIFPWQHPGAKWHRTWPIGPTEQVLTKRWRELLAHSGQERRSRFRESLHRKPDAAYQSLHNSAEKDAPILNLPNDAPHRPVRRYAYRSLDRQYAIADSRLGDLLRPPLWRAHGSQQTYITGFQSHVLGEGPAAVAAAAVPDMHHFRGSFGGGVIPLYRDAAATEPNVTGGLLERIGEAHGAPVSAERLFAYAYGILAQRAYVERFWDELEQPPPRLPVTKDAALFGRVADLGERLLHLHTYGERFTGGGRDSGVPHGEARCTRSVPPDRYPDGHAYDAERRVLRVGEGEHAGEFGPVAPEVWDYSVSGMRIVESWLNRRKANRSGRRSSPLDDIRPERWTFGEELLELLWVLEGTLALEREGAALLDEVCASPLFTAAELPQPSAAERRPPRPAPGEQADLL